MRAVVQRVSNASVSVAGKQVGSIGRGFVVLLGVCHQDTEADTEYLANKIAHLRIFEDGDGKMNLELKDVSGEILAISQFTLYASTRKGRRPSFISAALPELADRLYQHFIRLLRKAGIPVSQGVFGAMMMVNINNDGPVTIILDSEDRHKPRE